MGAVARCSVCETPLCGDHHRRLEKGAVLCQQHHQAALEEAKAKKVEEDAAQQRKLDAAREDRDRPMIAALRAIPSPLERLVRLVTEGELVPRDWPAAPLVKLPSYWDQVGLDLDIEYGLGSKDRCVSTQALARWFASRARFAGVAPAGAGNWPVEEGGSGRTFLNPDGTAMRVFGRQACDPEEWMSRYMVWQVGEYLWYPGDGGKFVHQLEEPARSTMAEMRRRILEIIPRAVEDGTRRNGKVDGLNFKVRGHEVARLFSFVTSDGTRHMTFTTGQSGFQNFPVDEPLSRARLQELIAPKLSASPFHHNAAASREELSRLVTVLIERYPRETAPSVAQVTWETRGLFGGKKREAYAVVDRLWPVAVDAHEGSYDALDRHGNRIELVSPPSGIELVPFDPSKMAIVKHLHGYHKCPPDWNPVDLVERLQDELEDRRAAFH